MAVVSAVSDVHSPLYLKEFLSTMGLRVRDSRLFILAGDMVLHSRISQYEPVLRGIRRAFAGDIVATLGNEENDSVKASLFRAYPDVVWLDDSEVTVEVEDRKVRIVGTRGSLAQPTSWQREHIPDILETYAERVNLIRKLLKRTGDDDLIILLSHYAPVRDTTQGEAENILPVIMDERMEGVVTETRPDIVIHGHAHNAKKLCAKVGTTRVFNVAFPAKRSTTVVDLW